MPRLFCALLFASVSLIALAPTIAFAASPSETQCIASGGTFTKVNGTDTCTTSGTVGGGNDNNSTTTSTNSGQGNTGNKTSTTCSGPGNSTSHC